MNRRLQRLRLNFQKVSKTIKILDTIQSNNLDRVISFKELIILKPMFTLTTYSQLKAMSNPLRVEMMMRLCERPYTGQLLSEKLGIPRAKIHYHLKELEKNGFIEIVFTEEKNGIVQKFYQSVARGFYPCCRTITSFRNSKRIRSPNLFTNDRKNEKPYSRCTRRSFLHYEKKAKILLIGITFHLAGNLMLRQNNFKCG